MTMYSAHDLYETPTPALFGFDLFHLVTFRLWPGALDLALLPRWFLALEITFTRQGRVMAGRVLGRGLYGEMRASLAGGRYPLWARAEDEDGSRCFALGRLWVVVDPRQGCMAAPAVR